MRRVVDMIARAIVEHVHVLIVDLFPPGRYDPQGIHKAVWDALEEEGFELPPGRPLIAASYDSGPIPVSYVEPLAVGGMLREMPLFLEPGSDVPAPLEASYQAAWDLFPAALKDRL